MTSPTLTPDQPPLVALVHKQLAALESLATDGYAEASVLRGDIATLAGQLNDAVTRLARLEATLQSHAQLLSAIRAGLTQMPAAQPAQQPAAPASPAAPPAAPATQAPQQPALPVVSLPAQPPAPPAAPVQAPQQPVFPAVSPPAHPPASAPPTPATAPTPSARPPARAAVSPATQAPSPQTPASPPPAAKPNPAPTPPPSAAGPQVQRGSRVRIVFDDDSTETYTIVRQEETNRQRNLIGENSPLGAALLGATVGELRSFRVRPTADEQMVEVLAIEG